MSEYIPQSDDHELEPNSLEVRVEYGGFIGRARVVRVGREALKWQITMFAQNGRELCYFDGTEIAGNESVTVTLDDIENAQHEINQVIHQFIWDPMSQG